MLTDPEASTAAAAAERDALLTERATAAAAAALKAKQRIHAANKGSKAAALPPPPPEALLPDGPPPGEEDLLEELGWAWREGVKTRRLAGCCVLTLTLSYLGLRFVRAAWSKWPSWRCHGWLRSARQAASKGLGLPSALVRSNPPPQIPPRGRGLSATRRPSRRFRCV